MTKNQKILELYEIYDKFTEYNIAKIAAQHAVDRRSVSYLNTLMKLSTIDQQALIKEAIKQNKKIRFSNGEITGSLEVGAMLVSKGHSVEGYGDPSMVVYLLECDGKIKIGVAKSISSRIAAMQTGNPYQITLKGEYKTASEQKARRIEKELHAKFSAKQLLGEWFALDEQETLEAIQYVEKEALKP